MKPRHLLTVSMLLVMWSAGTDCVAVDLFFPHGDEVLSLSDDDSFGPIALSSPYPILGRQRVSLWVNSNGVISLNQPFRYYLREPFPTMYDEAIVCPFWIDLDPRLGGTISHNNGMSDDSVTTRVAQLINQSFGHSFTPTGVFITTWESVPLFGDLHSTNTFQCVLATNGRDTFVFFLYADGLINGTGAQIGIDGGDGVDYYTIPGPFTSNVNQTGLWILQLDSHISGGPPDSSADLMVTSVGTTEATLEWTHVFNNSPDSFKVTCLPPVEGLDTSNTSQASYVNFTYSLTGLDEYTNYTCFFTARNIFGEGPTSDPIDILTDPAAPSGPPLNVTGRVHSPTSLMFEWSPPSEEERNGPLTGYSVVLEWEVGQEHRVDTADTNYTFTDLQQGTTYHCSIAASTSVGRGPYYNISIATTLEPTDVTSTASSKTTKDINILTHEIRPLGLIGGVSGGATFIVVMVIIVTVVILCTMLHKRKKNTTTNTDLEMEDPCHMYEKVEYPADIAIPNTYLEEPDKQKGGPTIESNSGRKGTAHQQKKHPMLPLTAKSIPSPLDTINSDGVYMSLNSTRGQEQQQSQYMSLSAATRDTSKSVGMTSAWRRAQGHQDASRWGDNPEEPVYMNQANTTCRT